ncbi:hypothetical protein HHI36_008078 [Cryptolaemus montrouzieri]|uniref:ATP synthase protein MI25 n=1 Tax=Cryptolaemus montrouzieri TaxID=559131 RepID=A0ABD2MRL6_9CUCU
MSRNEYPTSPLFRKYENLQQKIAKERNKRNYLLRCKKFNIVPKFLNVKPKFPPIFLLFYMLCLNLCIRNTYSQIHNLDNQIASTKRQINSQFPKHISEAVFSEQTKIYNESFTKVKSNNRKKIEFLFEKDAQKETKITTEWITNLTQIKIPFSVKQISGLGNKFTEIRKTTNYNDIIASIEAAIFNKAEE